MWIVIRPDAASAALAAASIISDRLRATPELVLGLATGRTMVPVYAELVRLHREEGLDFGRCQSINLDEYVGIPAADANSYHRFMQQHLFALVNIDPERVHLPNGVATDLESEAARYEAVIAGAGGIDLQLLGIGDTGHVGFNEPGSSLGSRTRALTLLRETREQNAAMFGGDWRDVPPRALTMGVGTIMEARELLLLATGANKADILARALQGPVDTEVTASAVQRHPICTVIADTAAAASLTPIA